MACLRDWKALSVLRLQLSAATGLPFACQDETWRMPTAIKLLFLACQDETQVQMGQVYRHGQSFVCAYKQTYNSY